MEKGEVKQKKSTLVAKWVVIGILIFGMTFSSFAYLVYALQSL